MMYPPPPCYGVSLCYGINPWYGVAYDQGWPGGCRNMRFMWIMCGCGSGWKSHPHYPRINICKTLTFFGPEVGLQEYKSRIIIIWLKLVDCFYYLMHIWCASMHIGQYSRMAILCVDPCYGVSHVMMLTLFKLLCYGLNPCYSVYPCYDVNICFGVILCNVTSPCYGVMQCYDVSLWYGVSQC